ncbi:MAG: redoxin domain-containing protein [Balneolaceae bacterium]|nr:redoxin domain-containing protein [Balneolaceae bacterium]
MKYFATPVLLALSILLISSCNKPQVTINGTIDYLGDSSLLIEDTPVHYKYAPVQRETLSVQDNGRFNRFINAKKHEIKQVVVGDEKYPLVVSPDYELTLTISRSDFPKNVTVQGYPEHWDQSYNQYLESIDGLSDSLKKEEDKMKKAQPNTVDSLSKYKYKKAEHFLNDTPLQAYYQKAVGEYLVFKIRAVEYNNRFLEEFNADSARKAVFKKADQLDFFTLESLKAQRAGIRDFAHYYARTFGIYDSVKTAYGKELSEYDIKRLAYKELNQKRLEVLEHIESREARAYAQMYLVAERISEQGLAIARPSYQAYLNEYADFPEYTDFLTYFYNEIKSVSPGQPAIPFSIPDIDGTLHTMEEYQGKYVLLDFWAGWCQPCLEEFSHMNELYSKYSREDLEILGISTDVDSLVWVQDIKRFDNPWPQLYGGNGFDQETFKAYKGGGIPFYILIDREGNIKRYNDIRPSFNLETLLDSLIANETL